MLTKIIFNHRGEKNAGLCNFFTPMYFTLVRGCDAIPYALCEYEILEFSHIISKSKILSNLLLLLTI